MNNDPDIQNCLTTKRQQANNGTRSLAKPKLERFAFYRAAGKTLAESYELAGANPGTTHKSAAVGGSRLAVIPGVRARIAYLREQRLAAGNIPTPANTLPDTAITPQTAREMLLARLWRAVRSDANPEAVAAVKALRDWLREDEQDSKAQQISDPAIIAGHILSISGDYAALDAAGRAAYCRRMIDSLGTLGLSREDMHAASAPAPDPAIAETQSVVNSVANKASITT